LLAVHRGIDREAIRRRLSEAQEHVLLCAWHVARQRARIKELISKGHDWEHSWELLTTLEESRILHVQRVERLKQVLRDADK
jgi:hypothetical protein